MLTAVPEFASHDAVFEELQRRPSGTHPDRDAALAATSGGALAGGDQGAGKGADLSPGGIPPGLGKSVFRISPTAPVLGVTLGGKPFTPICGIISGLPSAAGNTSRRSAAARAKVCQTSGMGLNYL